MRESVKASLAFVCLVSAVVSAILWFGLDRATTVGPLWLLGVPLVGLASLVTLLRMQFARDKLPDFLSQIEKRFYERDGFCFAVLPSVADGLCWVNIFFQNKYERRCQAVVLLRPSFGFWLTTRDIQNVMVTIPCEPAGFGQVSVPLPIPQQYQGKRQRLDVGASVKYPEGRGQILRFRDGMRVGKHNFHNAASVHLAVTLLTLGQVRLSKPATLTFTLPTDVAENLPGPIEPRIDHSWRLGDPVDIECVSRLAAV